MFLIDKLEWLTTLSAAGKNNRHEKSANKRMHNNQDSGARGSPGIGIGNLICKRRGMKLRKSEEWQRVRGNLPAVKRFEALIAADCSWEMQIMIPRNDKGKSRSTLIRFVGLNK